MHFSLYLFGDFNGTLVVAVEESDTANSPLVWERNGQWTDDWEDVALQLTGIEHRYEEGNCFELDKQRLPLISMFCAGFR